MCGFVKGDGTLGVEIIVKFSSQMVNNTVSVEFSGAEGTRYVVLGIDHPTSSGKVCFPSIVVLFRLTLRFCANSILERS